MRSAYRIFLITILILYLGLLAWLSLIPSSYFLQSPLNFKGIDKIVHVVIYSILSLLLFLLFLEFSRKSVSITCMYAFVLASSYGLLMECLQMWIRSISRSFELEDIAANCLGALIGITIGFVLSPGIMKRKVEISESDKKG